MYNARSHKSTIHTRQDAVCCMLLPLDSRHYHRGGGQQRDQVGQGRAAAVVSDEDGRLSQCQRAQLHHELARWPGLQCTHSQTQVRCRRRRVQLYMYTRARADGAGIEPAINMHECHRAGTGVGLVLIQKLKKGLLCYRTIQFVVLLPGVNGSPCCCGW